MATFQVPGADGCTSWKTATNLSSCQYHAMYISAAKTVALATDTHLLVGILQNKPTSGSAARVFTQAGGICKVYAGAAITTVGSLLTSDGSGHIIATTTDEDIVLGIALETAGAAGDVVEMLYTGPVPHSDASRYASGA